MREFDVRYPGPVAHVIVRATLVRNQDHSLAGEAMLQEEAPASGNTQTAIVAAMDQAVSKTMGDIRDFAANSAK